MCSADPVAGCGDVYIFHSLTSFHLFSLLFLIWLGGGGGGAVPGCAPFMREFE